MLESENAERFRKSFITTWLNDIYGGDLLKYLGIIFVSMSSLGFLQLFNVAALIPLVLAFGLWGGLLMIVSIIWLLRISSKYVQSTEQ